MLNLSEPFEGSFFDADYFENGRTTGKSWLMNYHWMPRRSFKEAFAYIDYLELDDESYVLDFGCAKGFIVKALRKLEIKSDGCDISEYALSFAPKGCWNCSDINSWDKYINYKYTHIIVKDVFEHLTVAKLDETLKNIKKLSNTIMCVIPMRDCGVYRIPEYHKDMSHLIAEDEIWWTNKFAENEWNVEKNCPYVVGLKDNWKSYANGVGNHVFIIKSK